MKKRLSQRWDEFSWERLQIVPISLRKSLYRQKNYYRSYKRVTICKKKAKKKGKVLLFKFFVLFLKSQKQSKNGVEHRFNPAFYVCIAPLCTGDLPRTAL